VPFSRKTIEGLTQPAVSVTPFNVALCKKTLQKKLKTPGPILPNLQEEPSHPS
jgi:hypothetical protein